MVLQIGLVSWMIYTTVILGNNGCGAVYIRELTVPRVIENGSTPAVTLDCDYKVAKKERTGLVLTWHLNNEISPIYQWIPRQKPQDLGLLKGRINMDYKVSEDPYKMHRALQILNPTTELSGIYKCKVSTFYSEDFLSREMIVYAPAKTIKIFFPKPSQDTVNVTCVADGLFPEPQVDILWGTNNKSSVAVNGAFVRITKQSGTYSVCIHKVLQEKDFPPDTVFECALSIPDTPYKVKKRVLYYPGRSSAQKVLATGLLVVVMALIHCDVL